MENYVRGSGKYRELLSKTLYFQEFLPAHEVEYLKSLQTKDILTNKDCSFINSISTKLVKTKCTLGGAYLVSAKEHKRQIEYSKALLETITDKHKKEDDFYQQNIKRWGSYKNYLLSDAWHDKRSLVLWSARHRCEKCRWKKATQVHHKHYKLIWGDEPSDALMAVCRPCHKQIHGIT